MADRSVAEAAAVLGVGRSWLYAKARNYEVTCQRYGRTLRFTPEQIDTIRKQYEQPAVSSRSLRRVS